MDRFENLSKIARDEFGITIKSKSPTGETFESLYGETKDGDRREKQIEEMASDLVKYSFFYNGNCLMNYSKTAKFLYQAGYRKQSEVIVEFSEAVKHIAEGVKFKNDVEKTAFIEMLDDLTRVKMRGSE